MKALLAVCGVVSLLLGLIGIVLPLLPTVPFLLLSAFCFARSSEWLHHWLITHPRLGPPILEWQTRGAISKRGKRAATVSIFTVFAISLALGLKPLILLVQLTVLACVLIFIWTRPN